MTLSHHGARRCVWLLLALLPLNTDYSSTEVQFFYQALSGLIVKYTTKNNPP
jgi:hypothetical protein